MKHRAMALLAGLLLVSQVSTHPVTAAGHRAEASIVYGESEREPRSPRTPDGRNASDSFTAGPIADVKVELVSGWWVGKERHSKFKLSNVGDGPAKGVRYVHQTLTDDTRVEHHSHAVWWSDPIHVGDMPANTFRFVVLVCKPQPHYICHVNIMDAYLDGSDKNLDNNGARDEV